MHDDCFADLWFDAWQRLLGQLGPDNSICLECGRSFSSVLATNGSPCCRREYLDARGLHRLAPQNLRVHAGRRHLAVQNGEEVRRRQLGHALASAERRRAHVRHQDNVVEVK